MKARNKKTTSPSSPIKTFKRLIDSSKSPIVGVSKARKKTQSKDLHLIINSLKENEKYRSAIVGKDFFGLNDFLERNKYLMPVEKDKQFIWTSLIMSLYTNEINDFIENKDIYENFFILGSYDEASEILDYIEDKYGISIWLINSKLELLQKSKGLEAQKEFLEEVVSADNIEVFIAYFSYVFSMRNEENYTIESYTSEVEPILEHSSIRDYCLYHLLPFNISDIKKTESVIFHEERHSIIDRYLAFISMLELELSRCRHNGIDLIKKCLKPIENINDPRIKKISTICLLDYNNFPLSGDIVKYDNYTKGLYELNIDRTKENLGVIVSSTLFSNNMFNIHTSDESIYSDAVKELYMGLSNKSKKDSALDKIMMLSLRCAKTEFSRYLSRYINDFRNNKNEDYNIYHSIILELDNPKIINTVEFIRLDIISGYRNFLTDRYKESPSLQLINALHKGYNEGCNDIKSLNIPNYRKKIYEGKHALNCGKYLDSQSIFSNIEFGSNLYLESQIKRNKVDAMISDDKVLESITVIVDHYLNNNNSISLYDISYYVELALEKNKKECYSSISFCILLSLCSKNINPKYESKLSDVFENIVDNFDVETPSELIEHIDEIGKDNLIYIFRYVCIPRILDDLTNFEDLSEIDEERIAICQILMELDVENELVYSSEIKTLTREEKINNLVNHMNNSKVNINEQGILNHVENTLTRLYKKYKKLLEDPELSFRVEKISEKLKALDSSLDDMTMHSSDRESSISFICLYLLNELSLNPTYGLDTHISTTIRHGAFEGQVRRAFDEAELLTANIKTSRTIDRLPSRWKESFKDYDDSKIKSICTSMESFTKKVTTEIDVYLKEILHVNQEHSMKKGKFSFSNFPFDKIKESIELSTTYEKFIETFIITYWDYVEGLMIELQDDIERDVKIKLSKALESMRRNILLHLNDKDSEQFGDCINEVSTNFEGYIDELEDWFTKPVSSSLDEFSFDFVSVVAQKQINNCYVRSKIKVEGELDSITKFNGSYFNYFVEVLFILFQNIIRHSGLDKNKAKVKFYISDSNVFLIVSNKIGTSIDIEKLKASLPDLNKKYSEEMAMEFANRERGSGISKIWKLIEHDINKKGEINFELDDKDNFIARLNFNVNGLLYEDLYN
ncbi:hypothetical protein BH581_02015 [Vibrio splendidus]|uniref:hypothetical protein n=1 Tax=Vibrio splendidus TaxID=29497 RepID=UPI000977F2B3|nr:hypothetical protein [Vibrio splendidus]OMO27664.1 hypothetical protein BH581_02015 [Vibrio splendidus]